MAGDNGQGIIIEVRNMFKEYTLHIYNDDHSGNTIIEQDLIQMMVNAPKLGTYKEGFIDKTHLMVEFYVYATHIEIKPIFSVDHSRIPQAIEEHYPSLIESIVM